MNENNPPSFSIRHGYEQPKPIQIEGMDDDLRNGLWNVFLRFFPYDYDYDTALYLPPYTMPEIFELIWESFFKKPSDEYPFITDFVKNIILSSDWNKVFDLIEFVIGDLSLSSEIKAKNNFIKQCNDILEQENSAYRIIQDRVTPITNKEEIESIKRSMSTLHQGANEHIKKALTLFSRRENPDYENSIKESISAVESIIKITTDKEKFSAGVNELENRGIKLHNAHKEALNKLYGFTSDADGIRHGSKEGEPLDININTARLMLITCSAFVNFIEAETPKKP